eukprot:Protomagalhaensia_sp_Gyna_25__5862@NODE_87_length_5382_cov_39_295901_g67_i0_p1_GENE_NODE_87_length_5382_cov_39_295901_g67_i0NODE_87_length_5382_cov_39_295901_g67_i0_p1_ORF_typecomplete_len1005_score185_42FH2/PF02181_23/2_9e51_NODE_87_length_5382_cov_39_295901_g67_i0863100
MEREPPVHLVLKTAPMGSTPSDNSPSTSSSLKMAAGPPSSGPLKPPPRVQSLATDILRVVEPLQESLTKLRLALPPETDTNKLIQCFVLKLDLFLETVGNLVEETETTTVVATAPSLTAFFQEFKKSPTKPKQPPPKKPPPAIPNSKRAPPLLKAKAPPPSKGPKKPPPRTGTTVPKLDLEDVSRANRDLTLERLPEPNLIPKAIQWLGLTADKAAGSIWENLLKVDQQSMSARVWGQRYVAPLQDCLSLDGDHPSSNETPSSLPCDAPSFKFEVQYPVLNSLFFQDANQKRKEAEKPLSEAVVASARTRNVSCLDPKRTQRIEISLKGCKLYDDFSPIYDTICNLKFDEVDNSKIPDDNGGGGPRKRQLDPATVQFLVEVYPAAEEVKALKNLAASLPPDQRIAPADQFLLELLKIPRFPQRAEAVCTKMSFSNELGIVMEKLSKLLKFCDLALEAVSAHGLLKPIFALILKMGNYINCKTKRALVPGLQMAALENLRQIKSVDGSKSFIRVVADHIEQQLPFAWKLLEWICVCNEAADINPDDQLSSLTQLESRVIKIDRELKNSEIQHDSRFITCFKDFVEQAFKRIQDLKGRIDEAKTKLLRLGEVLADKAKTPKEALDIYKKLSKFGKDLYACRKEIEVERQLAGKRKQRMIDRTPLAGKSSAPVLKLSKPLSKSLTETSAKAVPRSPEGSNSARQTSPPELPSTPPSTRTGFEPQMSSRLLKPIATAEPCSTPVRIVRRGAFQTTSQAVPRDPTAVAMLHGSRSKPQHPRRSIVLPNRGSGLSRRMEDAYDMGTEEIVLEEDLGSSGLGRMRSMQQLMSPLSRDSRLPVKSPSSSRYLRTDAPPLYLVRHTELSDELSASGSEDDDDEETARVLRFRPGGPRSRRPPLSRVTGDEVVSLNSQSSLGSNSIPFRLDHDRPPSAGASFAPPHIGTGQLTSLFSLSSTQSPLRRDYGPRLMPSGPPFGRQTPTGGGMYPTFNQSRASPRILDLYRPPHRYP